MGTQYNPNPNGASSAGWSLLNVTATWTGDGARLRKAATGLGGATQTIAIAGSARLMLAGVQIKRNTTDPLPEVILFGRNSQETILAGDDAWAPVGVWVTLPLISTPVSASGSAYVTLNSNAKYDVTVRRLYVYAFGDADATAKAPDLDAGDAAWVVTVPNNALTATAKWNAANDEWVDTLEWKASSGSAPYSLPASLTSSHTEVWTYTSAGTVTASLTVRNSAGDSFQVQKVFSVPSGVYQADFDYEADYLHVEVDAGDSIGAVIERWSWSWGDATTTNNQLVPYASHTYASPGTYYVQLTITNSMGQTSTLGQSVQVASVPTSPVDFTVALDKLSAVFTAQTTGTTYGWTFGDGGSATTPQAAHTYATAGTYTVVLTVDGVSESQSVTVSENYVPLDLANSLRLEVKQDPGDVIPWNRLPNPSGALGASGWATPFTKFSGVVAGPQGLRLEQAPGEALSVQVESAWVPVLPGRYVTGSFKLVQVDAPGSVRARVYFLDANGLDVGASTITGYQTAAGTYWTGPTKVPSAARYATLGLLLYGTAGPTFPPNGMGFTWREGQIASSLYQSEVTNPPYSEAGIWADVLGPTHEISISRGELDVSTLTATILDAELDPVVSDTIRPGAEVRLRVATERNGLRVWEPIYTGKANKATATYGRSNLEELVLSQTELVLNPTLTTDVDTYEVTGAGFALAPTADGGQITLTGYSTANVFHYAACLKIPVAGATEGRAYRVKIRSRRVSGGHPGGLRLYVRAFSAADVDLGAVNYDRVAPFTQTNVGGEPLTDPTAGVWRDNEFLIRPEYQWDAAATMNLWLAPTGNGTVSPNGVYTITDVSVVEEWTPPALPKLRKSTRITLEAWDAASPLAQTTEPQGVATLQEIPSLMESTGIPVTVDGAGNTGPDPQVATMNDNASLLDQIVAARDTQGGYAHVSREGVLTLQTAQGVSTLPAATLDESAYSDANVAFSTEDVINSVVVTWQRWDPTLGEAGEVVETIYGPYEDLESIREWGLRRESFTWVGQVENVPAINAQALAVLTANKTPQRRVHQVALPIRYATDLAPSRALLDLMDLVRVKHERTGLDQLLRLTEVKHTITARNGRTPTKWTMEVGFSTDGTVARPIAIPPAPPRKNTEGDWIPLASPNIYAANWVDYNAAGGTYAPGAYQVTVKSNGRRQVTLRGLIKTSIARTASGTMFTIPPDLAPEYNAIFNQATSATTTSAGVSTPSTGAASTGTAHTHVMPHTHVVATTGSRVDVAKGTGVVSITLSATLPIAANGFVSLEGIQWEVGPA